MIHFSKRKSGNFLCIEGYICLLTKQRKKKRKKKKEKASKEFIDVFSNLLLSLCIFVYSYQTSKPRCSHHRECGRETVLGKWVEAWKQTRTAGSRNGPRRERISSTTSGGPAVTQQSSASLVSLFQFSSTRASSANL